MISNYNQTDRPNLFRADRLVASSGRDPISPASLSPRGCRGFGGKAAAALLSRPAWSISRRPSAGIPRDCCMTAVGGQAV
jgi:hypothetical protein